MLSSAAPRPIIRRALGATGDEGDLTSSSSLSSGHNKIKKDAVFGGHKLTLQGGEKGGGQVADDGGRYIAGGLRQDERQTEAYVGRGSGGRQWTAADGSEQRRTAADGGGRRQFVGGAAVVWMMVVGSGVNNVWLIVSKRFFFAQGNCP